MILQGDALTTLKDINSETVDCIITSPPYWALRDYKVEGQIGQEKTIDEYVNKLVEIFNECKRVLKKEGTCWIVLGDTFAGSGNGAGDKNLTGKCKSTKGVIKFKPPDVDIPDKSLCMIPERFAIKMIDNGWILRNKIIWYKPNCMPSSATDRFTIDYEYIYFFVKSKKYYFKTQYEPLTENSDVEYRQRIRANKQYNSKEPYRNNTPYSKVKVPKNENPTLVYDPDGTIAKQLGMKKVGKNEYAFDVFQIEGHPPPNPQGRIKRTVWKIPTKPFPEAHFAVFPEELVKQCMDAGCPPSGMILDPFAGAGTVGVVALKHHRNFIGIELNPDYIKISKERLRPYWEQLKLPFELVQ